MKRYRVPAGTVVSICRHDDPKRQWRAHKTRRPLLQPEYRTDNVYGSSGAILIREGDWLVLLRRNKSRSTFENDTKAPISGVQT